MDRKRRSHDGNFKRAYTSPKKSRSGSRSPVSHHRSSPSHHGGHLYRNSPKRRRSRSKSHEPNSRRRYSKDVDYESRGSRSSEDRRRKHEDNSKVRKPNYRGPESRISIDKEIQIYVNQNRNSSPVRPSSIDKRIVIVRSGESQGGASSNEAHHRFDRRDYSDRRRHDSSRKYKAEEYDSRTSDRDRNGNSHSSRKREYSSYDINDTKHESRRYHGGVPRSRDRRRGSDHRSHSNHRDSFDDDRKDKKESNEEEDSQYDEDQNEDYEETEITSNGAVFPAQPMNPMFRAFMPRPFGFVPMAPVPMPPFRPPPLIPRIPLPFMRFRPPLRIPPPRFFPPPMF